MIGDDSQSTRESPTVTSSGGLYETVAATTFAMKPVGDWNQLQLRCAGDRIQVLWNGVPTVDANMNDYEMTRDRPRSGFLGFISYRNGKGASFRNIRIHELK